MTSQDLQFKINNLKAKLQLWQEGKQLIGVALFFENSSENWLFNTEIDINEIIPLITTKLSGEIAILEEQLIPLLEQERIQAELEAQQEAERLAAEQAAQAEQNKRNELQNKRTIGAAIINEYLFDNTLINLTPEQALQQLQKFQVIKVFLEVGNLEDAKSMIQASEIDTIFTQIRKEKYLAMFPL